MNNQVKHRYEEIDKGRIIFKEEINHELTIEQQLEEDYKKAVDGERCIRRKMIESLLKSKKINIDLIDIDSVLDGKIKLEEEIRRVNIN